MKKVLFLLPAILLSSCSLFTGKADSYLIENATFTVNGNGDAEVHISFRDDSRPDFVFTVPGGSDGVSGNGIASIDASTQGDSIVLTIHYTDATKEATTIRVPNRKGEDGRMVTGLRLGEDGDGNTTLCFSYSDGTESQILTIPKGQDGKDATHLVSAVEVEDVEEGTKVTFHYSDGSPDTVFLLSKGQDGTSIESVEILAYGPEGVTYRFYLSDGTSTDVVLPYDAPQEWITGVGKPSETIGQEDDFYVDIRTGDLYAKQKTGWTWLLTIDGYGSLAEPTYCQVVFDANGGRLPNGNQEVSFFVERDSYLTRAILSDNVGIPSRDGDSFLGWHTTPTYDPNSGRFSDTTPVLRDLHLYAWYDDSEGGM